MEYLVRWWVIAEAIGLLCLPICWHIFRRLPDRGFAFSKILGVLLITYALWIGGTIGWLPFSTGSAALVLLGLGVVAAALYARRWKAILAWLRAERAYVIAAELVFLGALLFVALLRSYAPAITNTEKPFEFANYNAVNRSAFFAPTDPWFSGKPLAYYYFGYTAAAGAAKLTGTPPAYAFNVDLAFTAALAAIAAFGLAANCGVILRGRGNVRGRWPVVVGLLAVLLFMGIGNLEGVFELAAVHGWNPQWVYQHLDVQGLQPRSSAHWWPADSIFGSSWRATRLGSDWNFLEFPFFSFLLGDLHPHVLALPFKLLAAGFALALVVSLDLSRARWWRESWLLTLFAALALGALVAAHPWDFPAFALLYVLVLGVAAIRGRRVGWRAAGLASTVIVVASLVLFLPFFFSARGSIHGIQPTEVAFRSSAVNSEGMYLPFQHFLLFWTPLMWPAVLFVWWCLAHQGWKRLRDNVVMAVGIVAALPIAWGFSVLVRHGAAGLRAEIEVRGWGWLTVLVLGLLLAAALLALWNEAFEANAAPGRQGRLFLLAATVVAVLLVYGPELFMVRDSSGTRANTTFKLWYSSWTLLSIVGAAGGLYALWQWRRLNWASRLARPAVIGLSAAVLVAALIYPLDASLNRTNGFSGPTTLDGLAYLEQADPDEYAASTWLNENVPDVETVLEGVGDSYSELGRIASRTGLPTVLDWPFHEQQQGAAPPLIAQRESDVASIYTATNVDVAFRLLVHYGVHYVVVGNPERRLYGGAGIAKFAQIGTAVFTSPSVTIYRIGPAPLLAVAP